MLKGAIFSLRDVVLREGDLDAGLFDELGKLIIWLRNRGVQPVFAANHTWTARLPDGTKRDMKGLLTEAWGAAPWYIASRGEMPFKPAAAAMEHILMQQGWKRHEVIFVGNTRNDMITARSAKLLFLNAVWHGVANPYGFQFDS